MTMTDDEKIKLERKAECTSLARMRFRLSKATDAFSMSAMIINLDETMGDHTYRGRETMAAYTAVQDQAQELVSLVQEIAKMCADIELRRPRE